MNKKGMCTEEVKELILLVVGIIVIVGVVIVVYQRLQGPVEAEGLRTKVELAAKTKDFLVGVSAPADVFRCGTKREYWNEKTIEGVSGKINKAVLRTYYSYGAEEQIDFFSDWAQSLGKLIPFKDRNLVICYICAIATNSKSFGPSEKFRKLIYDEYYVDNIYTGPFFSWDKDNEFIFDVEGLEIDLEKPLFIGYAISKFKEPYTFRTSSGFSGRIFVLTQEDLNNLCTEDYLFIDV